MTKRETIEPHTGDKRYVRRDDKGQFTDDQVDVGKSLAADQRQHSKTPAKPGRGAGDDVEWLGCWCLSNGSPGWFPEE